MWSSVVAPCLPDGCPLLASARSRSRSTAMHDGRVAPHPPRLPASDQLKARGGFSALKSKGSLLTSDIPSRLRSLSTRSDALAVGSVKVRSYMTLARSRASGSGLSGEPRVGPHAPDNPLPNGLCASCWTVANAQSRGSHPPCLWFLLNHLGRCLRGRAAMAPSGW